MVSFPPPPPPPRAGNPQKTLNFPHPQPQQANGQSGSHHSMNGSSPRLSFPPPPRAENGHAPTLAQPPQPALNQQYAPVNRFPPPPMPPSFNHAQNAAQQGIARPPMPPPAPSHAMSLPIGGAHARQARPPPPLSAPPIPSANLSSTPSATYLSPPNSSFPYAPPPPPPTTPHMHSTSDVRTAMPSSPLTHPSPPLPPGPPTNMPLATSHSMHPPPPMQAPPPPPQMPHISYPGHVQQHPIHHPLPPQLQQHQQSYPIQQQPVPKIDPKQIPRPPLFTRPQDVASEAATPHIYYTRTAAEQIPPATGPWTVSPPPADSRYIIHDDGNASPDMMRSTVYAFPQSRGVWHKTGDIPISVLCTPLAVPSQDFVSYLYPSPDGNALETELLSSSQVPVIPNAGQTPLRCGHCNAYWNPYFTNMKCNLCGSRTRNGRDNGDAFGMAMQYGTVEYEVDGPYLTRQPPVPPTFLYAIDMTCPDLISYLIVLQEIGAIFTKHWQQQQQQQQQAVTIPRMGFCLVSSAGIILRRNNHSDDNNNNDDDASDSRYSIVSDVTQEPFSPWPLEEWTFDMTQGAEAWQQSVQQIINELNVLKNLIRGKNAYGLDGFELSCGGAALAFMADALHETGGRATLITWRRPNFGVGRLPYREESSKDGKEYFTTYAPLQLLSHVPPGKEAEQAVPFYKSLAASAAKNRVTFDILFVSSPSLPRPYLDLATLGELCRATCGKLIWCRIPSAKVQECVLQELKTRVTEFVGYDAVFKVRCSDGIRIKSFMTSPGTLIDGGLSDSPELDLASVTSSTCIGVELEHRVGGIAKECRLIFIQSALLYTNIFGRRRVRVSTLALPVTSTPNDVFRSVDFAAMISVMMRDACNIFHKLPSQEEQKSPRSTARDFLYNKCVLMLSNYRQNTQAANSPSSQLILPERMQLLPLFCLCLFKSPMLRPAFLRRVDGMQSATIAPTADERSFFVWHASQAQPAHSMLMVHPNVFRVSTEDANDEIIGKYQDDLGLVVMPPTLHPSMETLADDGMYLIDDGFRVFFYIGKQVSEQEAEEVELDSDSEMAQHVNRLLWQMRVFTGKSTRPSYPPVLVARQQLHQQQPSALDHEAMNGMVLDAISGEKDYVDFLCELHRHVHQRVSST